MLIGLTIIIITDEMVQHLHRDFIMLMGDDGEHPIINVEHYF